MGRVIVAHPVGFSKFVDLMLQHLTIQNFALIEHYEIHFEKGMSVLTGETGAGKSILIDALGWVLGNRAESKMIRTGATRCDITAEFDIEKNHPVKTWLVENMLDQEDQCILRRSVTTDGKSRALINGQSVTLQQLSELSERLIDIHGQHEHHYLLKREHQRVLLDQYGQHQNLLVTLKKIYEAWKSLEQEKTQLLAKDQQQSLQDFLQCQYDEILTLQLQENEYQALEGEYKILNQGGKILENVHHILQILEPNDYDMSSLLQEANHGLNAIANHHSNLANAFENLSQAQVLIQEALRDLHQFVDHFHLNEERFSEITERLDALHRLARKHRTQPEALGELQKQLKAQLEQFAHINERLDEIHAQQESLRQQYQKTADQLTKKRTQAAQKFADQVSKKMHSLAMQEGQFFVKFLPQPDGLHLYGNETCEYWVQPNPGQATQPLTKIASGGELSRISLAIQVILASHSVIPTLIFDEVDVGIGGTTASVVGKSLKALAEFVQVLCVTHLPQVAAFGDHHYYVQKQVINKQTHTALIKLDKQPREEELARMLGGMHITPESLANAKTLLKQAEELM